jgi:hypothetical protein
MQFAFSFDMPKMVLMKLPNGCGMIAMFMDE